MTDIWLVVTLVLVLKSWNVGASVVSAARTAVSVDDNEAGHKDPPISSNAVAVRVDQDLERLQILLRTYPFVEHPLWGYWAYEESTTLTRSNKLYCMWR